MQLGHIAFGKLKISALNMRHGRKAPDISDILPSVRTRGILQPLLVRPEGDEFEIVAGRRRYFCAKAVVEERGEIEPLPCAIMEPGDDAAALEASLIENIARLDPDEMTQYENFARLVREGKSVEDIAQTFGITEIMVKRRLALGNLLPKIRDAYRKEEIDSDTIRHLTLASKAQQREWLGLFEDEEAYAPRGDQLKHWLFGGSAISTKVALFPLEEYDGQIVSDLFKEDGYFSDAAQFWERQNAAIAVKREALLAKGWGEVVVLETGQRFHDWEHRKTSRKQGGKVYITVSHRGEVEFHEGYLSAKEARRKEKNGTGETDGAPPKAGRPELTSTLQSYVDLHRHGAVRLALLDHPGAALRLVVAHVIGGSGLWQVKAEPRQAKSREIAASLAASAAEAAFAARRAEILSLLEIADEDQMIAFGRSDPYRTCMIFARLLKLSDEDVRRVLALVMAETLEAGGCLVEALGCYLKADHPRLLGWREWAAEGRDLVAALDGLPTPELYGPGGFPGRRGMEPGSGTTRVNRLRGGQLPSPLLSPQEAPPTLQLAPANQPAEPDQDEPIRIVPPAAHPQTITNAVRPEPERGKAQAHIVARALRFPHPTGPDFDALGHHAVVRLHVRILAVTSPVGRRGTAS